MHLNRQNAKGTENEIVNLYPTILHFTGYYGQAPTCTEYNYALAWASLSGGALRLVYLALGWCAGVLLANSGLHLPLLWLGAAVMFALFAWRVRQIETVALLLFALGGLRMAVTPVTSDLAAYNDLGGMTINGIVVGEPDRRDDRVQLRLAADTVTRAGSTTPTDGLVLVDAPPLTVVRYGDHVAATGSLRTPGASDRFSYADYLARSGVYSLMQNTSVEVTERGGDSIIGALIDLKAQAKTLIDQALPEPQAGLLEGILLGNERGIAPDVSDAFAATGAAHVIAISGFNMAILSGVIVGALRRLRVSPTHAALISIAVITVYTLFVGANPAVVRAALMSGLIVVGRALRRQTYLPASLAFAALVLSALNPLVLWDVSFQLSFFATLGLALFADPFTAVFDRVLDRLFTPTIKRWVGALLTEPLIVTLAVLVFTLPLTMLYFGQVSPVILLVNLLVVPVQPALLLIGGAATLIAFVLPPLAQLLYWFDLIPLSWTIDTVRLFARLPVYEVFIAANAVAGFFAITIGAAMLKAAQPNWSLRLSQRVQARLVISAALIAGLGLVVLIGALWISRPDGLLHIWLIDEGDSNAVLIETPRGAQILVDGGRYPSRLLTALGDHMPFTDRTIEALILTQPDEIQYNALPTVLDRYAVGVVLDHGQPNLSAPFVALHTRLAEMTELHVSAGYTLDSNDGVQIRVINPDHVPTLGESLDDNALVLRLTYGDVSFLLTSELSSDGQKALLKRGELVAASVLQMPEHGTALDRDFLAAVQPQVAIIGAEHPDLDVLDQIGDVPLYRTDQGGTIHLSTDGRSLWVVQDSRVSR